MSNKELAKSLLAKEWPQLVNVEGDDDGQLTKELLMLQPDVEEVATIANKAITKACEKAGINVKDVLEENLKLSVEFFLSGYNAGCNCVLRILMWGDDIYGVKFGKLIHEMFLIMRERFLACYEADEKIKETMRWFFAYGWDNLMHKFTEFHNKK